MISSEQALKIARANLCAYNFCSEYEDAYVIGIRREEDMTGIAIYKEDGHVTGLMSYILQKAYGKTDGTFRNLEIDPYVGS